MATDNMVHTEWTGQAVTDYWMNMHVSGAWSNIVLGGIILVVTWLSLHHDRTELKRPFSAISLFFVSIFCVNLVATLSHMIEHYPPIASTLRLQLDFVNHSAIGFCALWVEVSILERVRTLQIQRYLMGFPRAGFLAFVVGSFCAFQGINWSIRSEPNFAYAILDYMISLTTLLLFCINVVAKLPRSVDKRYEGYAVASFIILLLASIAHIGLQDILPVGKVIINANDVYHFMSAPAFFTFYKLKWHSTSIESTQV